MGQHGLSLVLDLADGPAAPSPGVTLPIKLHKGQTGKVYDVAR